MRKNRRSNNFESSNENDSYNIQENIDNENLNEEAPLNIKDMSFFQRIVYKIYAFFYILDDYIRNSNTTIKLIFILVSILFILIIIGICSLLLKL